METGQLLAFLGLVALGSYVQSVSGFAIALIIMGGVALLGVASVPVAANVVAIVALANIAVATYRLHGHVDRKIAAYASAGILLLTAPGLMILAHLSRHAVAVLELLLGVAILLSGILLMIRPHPLPTRSRPYTHFLAGGLGGLLSGLFGVGGPPLVVHLYRQPVALATQRTTLLAALAMMCVIRIALEAQRGNITPEVVELSLFSVPISVLSALLARRFPPPISEVAIRRVAFGLLCALGLSLIVGQL
jgi:uncharacterized membrane protein YfcA